MCLKESCRKVNHTKADSCGECGESKPVLSGWICIECNTKNHKGVKFCKKCVAAADVSKDFWCCAACAKPNRVDHIEDNSRCGYCEYDMAPMTVSESDAAQRAEEQALKFRQAQEQLDSISPKDAEEQFGAETPSIDELPVALLGDLPPAPPAPRKGATVRDAEDEAGGAAAPRGDETAVPKKTPLKNIPVIAKFAVARGPAATSRIGRARKPQLPNVPVGPPGFDWMCREPQCGTVNGGDDESCTACKSKITPDDWECQSCGSKCHWTRGACFACATTIPVSWQCRGCRAMTSIYESSCRSCHAPRPTVTPRLASEVKAEAASRGGHGHQPQVRRQDWACPSCQQQNFAFRTECFSCGCRWWR
jgi:hypothetical protein